MMLFNTSDAELFVVAFTTTVIGYEPVAPDTSITCSPLEATSK
jgi:hypothetical protein